MRHRELLIVLILAIPTIWALTVPGFYGASDDMHVAWLQQMDKAIKMAQFPPRYVPDLSFGFGYPLFNFIFPLPYYLGEVFHLLGWSLVDSIKLVFGFSLMGGALTMYWLARKLSGNFWIALAASVIYTYAPYRATDVYDRGAIGESLAFVFMPLVVLSIMAIDKQKHKLDRAWVGLGGLSLTALILTHNIVAYMFTPLVVVLGLVHLRKRLGAWLSIFGLGLLGSIYFWWPAVKESGLMKYDTVFNFIDHFPTLRQLFLPFWGYGASVPGPYDGMSFYIGWVNILLLLFLIIFLLINGLKDLKKISFFWWWLVGLIVISLFLMNFRSTWWWKNIPLLAYFQFPWRFLTLVIFGTSISVVLAVKWKFYKLLAIGLIVISMGLNYYKFRPHDFLGRMDNYYINRYIPVPVPSEEYKTLAEEYLRLPKVTKTRPTNLYPRISGSGGKIEIIKLGNDLETVFRLVSDTSVVIDYNKYFFPGWRVSVDGKSIKIGAGQPYGQINFAVPAGSHLVSVNFGEPGYKIILDILSLISLLTAIGLSLGFRKNK